MSLSLLQGYSSEEEVQEKLSSDSDNESENESVELPTKVKTKVKRAGGSLLPSADDIFSEITGPPEFLKNSVWDPISRRQHHQARIESNLDSKLLKDPPPGAVVEAKAQLVGIHERVRSDADNGLLEEVLLPTIPPIFLKENEGSEKRKTVKDKEKSKRMRGQSSHASWKSESEMQLRQQFD